MITLSSVYSEAMIACIGSCLIDISAIPVVMTATREEDYIVPEYATLYAAIRRLWADRKTIDPVIVLQEAGADYKQLIRECMEMTPTAANVRRYCDILRSEATLYRIRTAAEELTGAVGMDDAMAAVEKINQLAVRPTVRRTSMDRGISQWMEEMGADAPTQYLTWGLPKLDGAIHVGAGDFVVLGADSSVGKTALAIQLAYNMAATGKRVALYSLETSERTLMRRLIAQQAQVCIRAQQDREIDTETWKRAYAWAKTAHQIPLDLVDAADMDLPDIRADIVAHRYEVVWIDYIQLMDAPGRTSVEEVRYISKYLHKMARALGVTVIGLSQITVPDGAADDWQPTKDSLRESRQLKNDADVILLLSLCLRSVPSGNRRLTIAKNKEGTLGKFVLKFDGAYMRFAPCDQADDLPDRAERRSRGNRR